MDEPSKTRRFSLKVCLLLLATALTLASLLLRHPSNAKHDREFFAVFVLLIITIVVLIWGAIKRWRRFSLRNLFLLVLVIALSLWTIIKARQQAVAVAALARM